MKKTVTQLAWDNMGQNKNGWEVETDHEQPVTNEVKNAPAPGTAKTSNAAVTNEVAKPEKTDSESTTIANEVKNAPEDTEPSGVVLDPEFFKAARGLSKSQIKDFLDINQVTYKQNAGHDALISILGKHLKGDIETLKSEFSL